MTKNDELYQLGVQQAKEEEDLENEFYKTHERPRGRGEPIIPGMKELKERYRQRYFDILEKYKNT